MPWKAVIGIALLASAVPGSAQVGEPILSVGASHFRWRTTAGPHRHIVDCRTRACDRSDFARGNLDNAFGLRAGLETTVTRHGALRLLAGIEGQVLFTEYNLSQHDVGIGDLDGVLGGALDPGPIELLLRAGAIHVLAEGVAPDDGFTGYQPWGYRVGRWGDYSAAVADESGAVRVATEYVPARPRSLWGNWGTRISVITP